MTSKQSFKGGTLRYLPADELKVHRKAQRALDVKRAQHIADNLDPDFFGTLIVVEQGGVYYIVDGQHRWWAARKAYGTGQMLPCHVIPVQDDAEAAKIFLAVNIDRKHVQAIDKYLNRLTTRDPAALAIQAILKRHDLVAQMSSADGSVRAIDACDAVYSRPRGDELLNRTIGILREAWGRDADAYNAPLVRGLGLFIQKHGAAVDDTELSRKLAKSGTPLTFLGQVRSLRDAVGFSIVQAAAEKFLLTYNKGKRTGALAEAA